MFALAPYMPRQHWTRTWELAEAVGNLKISKVPGSNVTRWEQFFDVRPDYKKTVILPFGQPVMCHIPVERRTDPFERHAKLSAYCSPDFSSPGSIIVWDFNTKRFSSQCTYKILPRNQVPYAWRPLDPAIRQPRNPPPDYRAIQAAHPPDARLNDPYESIHSEGAQDVPAVEPNAEVYPPDFPSPRPRRQYNRRPRNPDGSLSDPRAMPRAVPTSSEGVQHEPEVISRSEGATVTNDPLPPVMDSIETVPVIPQTSITDSVSTVPSPTVSDVIPSTVPSAPMISSSDPVPTSRYPRRSTVDYEPGHYAKLRHIDAAEGVSTTIWESLAVERSSKRRQRRKRLHTVRIVATEDEIKTNVTLLNARGDVIRCSGRRIKVVRDQHMRATKAIVQNTEQSAKKLKQRNFDNPTLTQAKIKSMTARGSSSKLLMAIQAKTDAYSMVLDVKGAYLKSDIKDLNKEKIYLKLPDGRVVQLLKYMYGLKQAGREWQVNLTTTLTGAGYSQSTADPLVFSKWNDNHFTIMAVHVDDLYVVSSTKEGLNDLYNTLTTAYNDVTRKQGDLVTYLGMAIHHDIKNGLVTVSQPAYIDKMLLLANIHDGKTTTTPMAVNQEVNNKLSDIKVDKTNYLSLVGLINYLASYSRPDLLYSLSRVAQACSDPSQADLTRVKRILRYIKYTRDQGLKFKKDNDFNLVCYVDASHNCYDDGKGHYGYTLSLGEGSGAFYAKSSKLRINTLSSTES
eukprot:gene36448-47456_t